MGVVRRERDDRRDAGAGRANNNANANAGGTPRGEKVCLKWICGECKRVTTPNVPCPDGLHTAKMSKLIFLNDNFKLGRPCSGVIG